MSLHAFTPSQLVSDACPSDDVARKPVGLAAARGAASGAA